MKGRAPSVASTDGNRARAGERKGRPRAPFDNRNLLRGDHRTPRNATFHSWVAPTPIRAAELLLGSRSRSPVITSRCIIREEAQRETLDYHLRVLTRRSPFAREFPRESRALQRTVHARNSERFPSGDVSKFGRHRCDATRRHRRPTLFAPRPLPATAACQQVPTYVTRFLSPQRRK